ncbi:bolA-like protein 3 isoform X2 [Hemicordylus capensis]|uniref:bolA-like protein 3 isoform X2 n=1 Tax=Hemicordylus capensis TaxID=884348 RepID=UPI002302CB72|nr:bolA-like protein 3 isoform X2 [Hemicordylus capensis]
MAAAVAGVLSCRRKGPSGITSAVLESPFHAASIMVTSEEPFSTKILFILHNTVRTFASQTDGEARVTQVLKEKFPQAAAIKVVDISGGCGAMYEIHIESEQFKEKRIVQQHQMVTQALRKEIKSMHGLRIFTSVPKDGS